MKDIFVESVNSYQGLDDIRKDAIISLYRTLFEADESKEKKEEKKEEKKDDKKEDTKEDKPKVDLENAEGWPCKVSRNRTPINVRQRPKYGNVQFIALHYTAGPSSAPGKARSTQFRPKTSADFIVDDAEIYQYNPDIDKYYTFAVGVEPEQYTANLEEANKRGTHGAGVLKKDAGNPNTVSIEMCSNFKGTITKKTSPYDERYSLSEATLGNTAVLVAYLKKKYPNARIVRHFDITGKPCPGPWSRDDNGTAIFQSFVQRCLSTPAPGDPEYENVEDALLQKDREPSWPDFGRQFIPDKTATTAADIATGLEGNEILDTLSKSLGIPGVKVIGDIITKNLDKVDPRVVKDFVGMLFNPKNKEMLKNVLNK